MWGDSGNQYVTIGTGASGIMLYNPHVVWNATNAGAAIRYGRAGGVSGGYYWDVGTRSDNSFSFSLNGSSDHKMTIASSGNVGIGTLAGTGNRTVYSDASGTLTNSSSDVRLKKNIETLSGKIDVLGALGKLRGVYYNWNTDIAAAKNLGNQREVGMVAQEVEQVLPELVGTNSNGYKSLDYVKFSAFLLEAVKAQQGQIEQLKMEIEEMKRK